MAGPYYSKVPAGTPNSGTFRGLWSASQTWAVGDIVVPTVAYATAAAKGYIYRCTTGGAGGGSEPTWVYTTPGSSTTTDSSAVWTVENATTWAYATPRPDYIINNKLAASEILYSENGNYPISADTTFAMPGALTTPSQWISTSDTTNAPPTTVNAGALIDGSASTGVDITIHGKAYIYGVGLKSGGSTINASITIGSIDESVLLLDTCPITIACSGGTSQIIIGNSGAAASIKVYTKSCTFTLGANAGQNISPFAEWQDYNSTVSVSTQPTALFKDASGQITQHGTDLSAVTSTLISASASRKSEYEFIQCKLSSGVAVMATQTGPAHNEAWLYDCASGDTHYEFAHYNYYGNTTISTAIYVSGADGASYNAADAKHSWKVTGVNGTFEAPYISPWISKYNEGTSAVTPRLEVMRDNNSTAYKDDEVWAEFSAKVTANVTTATINNSDRCAILTHNAGTASNQASSALGAGDWAGETGTPWFGKLEPSATITPAEIGDICARVCVAGANTVYVNPKILGL